MSSEQDYCNFTPSKYMEWDLTVRETLGGIFNHGVARGAGVFIGRMHRDSPDEFLYGSAIPLCGLQDPSAAAKADR